MLVVGVVNFVVMFPIGLGEGCSCSIYLYWCPPTPFSYQIMFMLFICNTTGATSGTATAYSSGAHEFIPGHILIGFTLLNLHVFVL